MPHEDSVWVVMPPSFDYWEGLFLPDPGRARTAALAALTVDRLREAGRPVFFDPGAMGLRAQETAAWLRRARARAAVVVAPGHAAASACILAGALDLAGLDCGAPILSIPGDADFLCLMERRLEALWAEPVQPAAEVAPASSKGSCFLLLERGERIPSLGSSFIRSDDLWRRASPGQAGGLPAWVQEVSRITGIEMARGRLAGRGPGDLCAYRLPTLDSDPSEGIDACRLLLQAAGPGRFRLFLEEPIPPATPRAGGAAWAALYGIGNLASREFLERLLRSCLPSRLCEFNVLVGLYEMGSDPLEEMYAGNGLIERNRALLENIVP